MKKLVLLIVILLSSLALASCATASFGDIFESIKIGYQDGDSATSVTKNITLPTKTNLDKKVSISWGSSELEYCSITGNIVRDANENIDVTLTVTLTKGTQVESEQRKITIIKAEPTTITVTEAYSKNLSQAIIVRGVYVDRTKEDYFWISDERRGILVNSEGSLFDGIELYDEVIVYGTLEEFTNAQSYQINASSVEKVEKQIVLQDNIITDFSETNLRLHVNDRVSFSGFHINTSPKVGTAFSLVNGNININVYIESGVPNKQAIQDHLASFSVGQEVEINNAILTFYGQGTLKSPEVFISRPDQFILPNIDVNSKLDYIKNFVLDLYGNKILTVDTSFIVSGAYSSNITYQVESPYISISPTGVVTITRPSSTTGDQVVSITCSATIDSITLSFSFNVTIKAQVEASGVLTYYFNFDNFNLPLAPNGYSEAYAENNALIMTSDVNGVISELSVYKNRWQLTAPAGFEVVYGKGARFAPRLNNGEVTPATLGFDLTTLNLSITMLSFDCGMLSGMAIDYASVEYYDGAQWISVSFLDLIGIGAYNHIEITGINSSIVRIVVNASTAGNNNNIYLTIDNLGLYTVSLT